MNKKYHVRLSEQERAKVEEVQMEATTPRSIRKRCNVLLMSDESVGKPPNQEEIAKRCGVSAVTVFKLVKEYALEGIACCLKRREHKSPPNPPIVTGEKEARIIALACGNPPSGFSRWTVRLLTEKVIELSILPEASRETIRRTLKKRNLSLI